MVEPEEATAFKAFAIERSRDPAEGMTARQRALMACIVIPPEIQKWMLDVGAVEPLLDSVEKTITAAELASSSAEVERLRRDCAAENERLRECVRYLGEIGDVCTYDDLGEVCGNCRCQRKPLTASEQGGPGEPGPS
jgi:hypothetical protein